MFKAQISGKERLLALVGIAPAAGGIEIDEAAFIADRHRAALGIVGDLGHIEPADKGLYQIGDDLVFGIEKAQPDPAGLALPRLVNRNAHHLGRHRRERDRGASCDHGIAFFERAKAQKRAKPGPDLAVPGKLPEP